MKLDPKKARVAKLVDLLKKLGAVASKGKPKPYRDWAGETAKTLAAGKLEDFDLTEFVVAAFSADLSAPPDMPINQPYAEALFELIEQMGKAGVRSVDRVRNIREALSRRLKTQV